MKIRRRTQGFRISTLFGWFRPTDWVNAIANRLSGNSGGDDWLERVEYSTPEENTPAEPVAAAALDAPPAPEKPIETSHEASAPPPESDPARIAEWRRKAAALIKRRPAVWAISSAFVLTWIVGYAIAAFILFPAPFLTAQQTVPRLLGMSQADAEARLADDGLPAPVLDFETHPFAERGSVIWQDPPPGVVVPEIATIALVISNGPQRIPVPDLSGFEVTLARTLLEAAGLTVGRYEEVQTAVARGVTVNTRPAPGATLLPGAPVTLVVSVGAPNVGIPSLFGLSREEARDTLEAVGLQLGDVERRTSSAHEPGLIIEQRPAAGTLAAPGTVVTIILAREPR